MKLPKYLLCSNREELSGQSLILQTSKPYYVARVWTYTDFNAYLDMVNNNSFFAFAPVDGYQIILTLSGSIFGTVMNISPETESEAVAVLEEMKGFLFQERINHKPGYYKKYKL